MPGDEIVHDLRGPLVGNVRHHGAGAAREQRAVEMRRGADALRAVGDLARIGLGVGDQLARPCWRENPSAPPARSGSWS